MYLFQYIVDDVLALKVFLEVDTVLHYAHSF